MPRNETLILRILRLVKARAPASVEEGSILNSLGRDPLLLHQVREQLHYLREHGLLKAIRLPRNKVAYALDWPGYDYLEGN